MALNHFVAGLPDNKQIQPALYLCRQALPVWKKQAHRKELQYRGLVVGLSHTIQASILEEALTAAETFTRKRMRCKSSLPAEVFYRRSGIRKAHFKLEKRNRKKSAGKKAFSAPTFRL